MFIVQLNYQCDPNEIDKYLQAHRDFLDYHFKQGLFLAAGHLKPRTGDIIIALTNDRKQLESVLQEDPYYLADLAHYTLTEFTPASHRDEIKDLILHTEGKLC